MVRLVYIDLPSFLGRTIRRRRFAAPRSRSETDRSNPRVFLLRRLGPSVVQGKLGDSVAPHGKTKLIHHL